MKALDSFGALLLGAAIRKVFPHIDYHGSTADASGFFSEFDDDQKFQESYLPLIEKAMKELLEADYTPMEMVGENASEMLRHYNEKRLAEGLSGIVEIAKLGEYFDVVQGPLEKCAAFLLLRFEQKGKRVRIFGKAFASHPEKQTFEKKYRNHVGHEKIAQDLELYEGDVWLPRGMLLKHALEEILREFLTERGFEDVSQQIERQRFVVEDKAYFFHADAKEIVLSFVQTWFTIFDIDYAIEKGKKLEVYASDALGCFHLISLIEPLKKKGVSFTLCKDVKKWIALLLEKHKGNLPLWLQPEHVRLIPEEGTDFSPLIEIFRRVKMRYTVDLEEGSSKEKIHRALHGKVPYVIVFSKTEEKAKSMTIRAYSSKQSETVSLGQLESFLLEQKFESK